MFGRGYRRAVVCCLLLLPAVLIVLACYSGAPVDRAGLDQAKARENRVRLTYAQGYVILMPNWTLEYPYIIGEIDESKGMVASDPVEKFHHLRRFNLDEATKIETYKLSPWKIGGLSAGAAVAGVALMALLIASSSCPTVHVIDGAQQTLAGEAYPGAIFRSVQRDDLLALPSVDGRTLTLRLTNSNPEIQYTDSAKVILVEHGPSQRALATHDGRAVLVEGTQAPSRAVDLDGNDVMDRVRAIDDAVWQSDLDRAFLARRRDLREGLIVTFERPQGNALEITAENTLWMSAVFHQGFEMLGSTFGPTMNAANKAERAGIEAWRAREGVDLRVEILRDGAWTQVAVVQTPGMAALRTMLVPIGVGDAEELQVRMSGGFGFWRIGSVALTTIVDESPETTVIAATNDLMAEKDGRYHVLSEYGQAVDLTFDLPEAIGARSAFLASSGWYNPLPPRRKLPQVTALNMLRTTPGGLAQLGIDLYARNREHLQEERAR